MTNSPPSPTPTVRVIVLNWNAADLTSRCVRSIEASEWPADALDLVIVDNASIDGSAEVLARRHPRWTLIRNEANLGFAEGINRALRPGVDTTPYIALVNNDAVVDSSWLAPLVETLTENPSAGAAAPLMVFDRWFVNVELKVGQGHSGGAAERARLTSVTVNGAERWAQVLCDEGIARPPHPSVPLRLEIEIASSGTIAVPVPAAGPGMLGGEPQPVVELALRSDRPVTARCGAAEVHGTPTAGAVRLQLDAAAQPHRRINSLGTALTEFSEGYERRLGEPIDAAVLSPDAGPVVGAGPAAEPEIVPGFTGGGVLLRSHALADVGLFDPRFFMYYEDTDLAWRMRRAGWTTITAPTSVLYHQLGATAGSSWPGFFLLNHRNWLLTVARNGTIGDNTRALRTAWGNSWPFVRRNVVGKVRRLQRPNTDIAGRWVSVAAATKAALPRTLATRFSDRWRMVGNEQTDTVGSRLLRRSTPAVPAPLVDGPTVVFVDVTDTLGSRWRAGIQRAVSELVARLILAHAEVSVVLMMWSPLDQCYRRLDGAETEAFFDPEAMPNHPPAAPPANPPAWRRVITKVGAIPTVRSRIDQARRLRSLRQRPAHLGDLVIEAFPAGATLLDLDATWNLDDAPRALMYPRLRQRGVRVVSLLHDVLPVTHPDWFDPNLARVFQNHVAGAVDHADVIVTSSAFSAGEIAELAAQAGRTDLSVEQIALGADPVARAAQPADAVLVDSLADRDVILVVGTLEPRKNHVGLLDAFDRLEADATLVVVGRQGWKADDIASRIRNHPRFGDRLRWPSEVNDATLDALYDLAVAVAVPSHAEGYGLPVVEALRHGCRVVSSTGGSLPEVGGDDVSYVDATDAVALAAALDAAITEGRGSAASSEAISFPTWDDSAASLAAILTRR